MSRLYGHSGTIHQTEHLDVETHDGQVVAVWFRCQLLPFKQVGVDVTRAQDMVGAYNRDFGRSIPKLLAVELEDV